MKTDKASKSATAPTGSERPAPWSITRERCEQIINDINEGIEPRTNHYKLIAAIHMLADDRMKAWAEFNILRDQLVTMGIKALGIKHPSQNESSSPTAARPRLTKGNEMTESQETHSLTPAQRLRKAGWQKRRNGWESPYTRSVLPEERALGIEDFMARGPVSENDKDQATASTKL